VDPTSALRHLLFSRCRGYCEKCGWPLGTVWAMHHRKLRKHGGADTIENVLALHHDCHNIVPDSVHQEPQWSYDHGFLVIATGDPAATPVRLHGNKWVLLTADGKYQHLTEEEAHAAQLDAF